MSTAHPAEHEAAIDAHALLNEWLKTREARLLEADEAQAVFELLDSLCAQIATLDDVAIDLGRSLSRSLTRQNQMTTLLYGIGYTSQQYDRHGIINTPRTPGFLEPCVETSAPHARPGQRGRHKKRARR